MGVCASVPEDSRDTLGGESESKREERAAGGARARKESHREACLERGGV